jgi:predicted transcriptional regulator
MALPGPGDSGGAVGREDVLRLTARMVAAFVARNAVAVSALPPLIGQVSDVVAGLAARKAAAEIPKPAVPINRSIQRDYIVCLEDGKRLKMLKRHLRARYGMTPDDYRRRWGLGPDYPMVAPAYAERRSQFAKQIGLGRGGRREG